jgi:hypothetical protein
MKKFLACISVASFVFALGAQAAEPFAQASQISGKVLVNHGQGFEALTSAENLAVGDQVLVGADGHVVLTYAALNCSVDIAQPKTLTISKTGGCKKGQSVALVDSTFVEPVNAMGAGFALTFGTKMALGVIAIAAVGGGTMLLLKNNKATCNAAVSACP